MKILGALQTHTTDTFLFISHTMNVLLFKFRCNILIGVRIIKEMPGSVASGTSCTSRLCHGTRRLGASLIPRRFKCVPRPRPVTFVVGKVALEEISSRNDNVFPCQYHSTNAPCSFSYCYYSHQKDKRGKAWEPSNKAIPLSDVGKQREEKYFRIILLLYAR